MSREMAEGIGAGGVLKRLFLGRAITSHAAEHQLMPKVLALPVFASDQLSSVAYATEEMMLVLVLVGVTGLSLLVPLGIGVAALLVVVIASYRQTVHAYPRGGGSYIVARENLGTIAGLTSAAAILTSYVLTVAVSVTAGAIAVTSAVPSLAGQRVLLAVAFIALITLANLRGAKEAGRVFAVPTYGFVVVVAITLVAGFWQCATNGCPQAASSDVPLEAVAGLTLFLALRAFSSGATALTGVEAIADGVQAFRRPQARNAASTLLVMGAMSIPMFLGITVMAKLLDVRVHEDLAGHKSVLAQIGETIFPNGPMFIVLQVFTGLILILAANTAYQDFPRLSSILARDRFMPSQFRNRGDRLVYSNGIAVLSIMAALLVWLFEANLTRLIQLYVVGVFTALTLSQAGMVRRWFRIKGAGWHGRAALNIVGATTTGVALAIVIVTRFALGAWMVLAAVPVIIVFFLGVNRHYRHVGELLRSRALTPGASGTNVSVLLVRDLGPATLDAVAYLFALRPERLVPLYVGEASGFEDAADRWGFIAPRLGPLERLDVPAAKRRRALRRYLRELRSGDDGFVTLVIPEIVEARGWREYLRGRSSLWLKASLMFEPGIVVTDVPLVPGESAPDPGAQRPLEPSRSVVLIPISEVHDATVRAVDYATALHPTSVEALFLAPDPDEVPAIVQAWGDKRMTIPLVVVDAPFRDIGEPLLDEVRAHTKRGDTIVTVVLPEFVVERWWENLLHNQTGLYIKRLLLFEPRVVVTSVPFHLTPAPPDVPVLAPQPS
jgi:amino acid transporter